MDAEARMRDAGEALHDLNNGLAALRMSLALARTTLTDAPAQAEIRRAEGLAEDVAAASRRLGAALVGDLAPAAQTPPAAPARAAARAAVLVVDDDAVIRAVVARLLGRAGYRVRAAGDAEEAEGMLVAGEPADVLVSDLELPGHDGRWLSERAQRLRPGIGVVLLSGRPLPAGTGAWLPKPFAPEALLAAVAEAVPQDPGGA